MVVSHNLQAMNANRMLGNTTIELGSSTEKLSSGYRINRSADDAAGLSISEKMRKQIRGLSRASVNSEDGISCVQTADGAMTEVQDMLQRMNELCVQSANGTLSVTDREYIQDEVDQLISEIDRISETAKFNETYLLKGDEKKKSKVYVTDYSISPARNLIPNKTVFYNGDPIDKKIKYRGTNNLYFASSDISKNGEKTLSADVIHTGDDLTEYLIYTDTDYNSYNVGMSSDYKCFTCIELDSRIGTKADGNSDLYKDVNGVVTANRRLYFYDTEIGAITKLEANSPVSEYLNDDNTVKDKYRFLDIMDGSGKFKYDTETVKETAEAQTGNAHVYYFDENRNLKSVTYHAGDTVIKSVYTVNGLGRYGFQETNGAIHTKDDGSCAYNAEYHTHYSSDTLIMFNNKLYSMDFQNHGNIYECNRIDLSTKIKLVNINDSNDSIYVKSALFTETHKTTQEYNDDYSNTQFKYLTPYNLYTVNVDDSSDGNLVWTDDFIEYDYTPEKLYDADGNEVSAIKLNEYFDKDGNYKGGLFNNPQAAAVHEVFNPLEAPTASRNIETYITQCSTLENDALNINIQAGSDSNRNNKVGIEIENMNAARLGINKLASQYIGIVDDDGEKATDAIDVVANAINMISMQRAKMGAIQNRLEHTIKNLDNIVENTTSAESLIRDTDMADEMVKYSNYNILQQAGQSILAQANQTKQGVLSLLQ